MSISNRELAENPTWIAAVSFCECPDCGFLSYDLKLDRVAEPCPNCATSGRPRRVYPDFASVRLLEMIAHFYARAYEHQNDADEQLARALEEDAGRRFDCNTAVDAAHEVQELYRSLGGSQEAFEKILAAIQKRLSLPSLQHAQRAFVHLFQYSDTSEEHQIVVLLTAAMLEKLFRELLLSMCTAVRGDREKARRELKQRRDFKKREQFFKELAGHTLQNVLSGMDDAFYSRWQIIRNRRNHFLHGVPFVIDVSDTETAFELSKTAFMVFAKIQNRFCVIDPGLSPIRCDTASPGAPS